MSRQLRFDREFNSACHQKHRKTIEKLSIIYPQSGCRNRMATGIIDDKLLRGHAVLPQPLMQPQTPFLNGHNVAESEGASVPAGRLVLRNSN